MSDYNYILNLLRAQKDMSERLAVLEEVLRDTERNIGMLEKKNELLREIRGGLGNHDEVEKYGDDAVERNVWIGKETEHPIKIILTQNPYVECEERRLRGETWGCRVDDGHYSSATSVPFYEHQRRTPTMKSDSETAGVADKPFERSNAPSPDEHHHRERRWEAAREQERGSLRQIQTEMTVLDLIARIERLEDSSMSERGNGNNNIRLRGGKGVYDKDRGFFCDSGGYIKWSEVDAKRAAEAQVQASKENPKVIIAEDGHRTAILASSRRPCHQVRSQAGDVKPLTPQARSGAGEDIHQAIQRQTSVNLGLENESNSIYGRLGQESMLSFLTAPRPGDDYTDASIALATVLRTRNYFLERELQDFKEMNDSLVQGRNWQMSMQDELEKRLEAVKIDRDDIFDELKSLRKRWETLVEVFVESENQKREWRSCNEDTRFPEVTMRGGGEESGLNLTQEGNTEDMVPPDYPESFPISSESSDYASEYDASFQSPPEIATTNFDFFARESTIIFGGDSPHIYQFPSKFTLPQIRELLESENVKERTRDDVYVSRVLEILKIREDMGLKLPGNLNEERVSIGLPDVPIRVHRDNNLNIGAWQTVDTDIKDSEKSVQRIDISSSLAVGAKETSLKTSSSDEGDTYQDISGLFNSLNEPYTDLNEREIGFANFCACASCTKDGRKTYFNICDMQPLSTVRVRGGGDDLYESYTTSSYSSGSPHLSSLLSSSPSPVPEARLTAPFRYGNHTSTHNTLETSNKYESAITKGPLSTRLAKLLFPPSLAQGREDSIRRFNWRHVKRMNPQFKNKCSRGFRYRKNPLCEDWVNQLDRHLEYCDYCQAMLIEEERLIQKEGEAENSRHEHDAPVPNIGVTRPWDNGSWPSDFYDALSPAVQVPDSRLRGDAGHEDEMKCEGKDIEHWKAEWHDLSAQARGTKCMSRAYRNSSSRSTKTQIQPMEPISRDFGSRWKLREERDGLDVGVDDPHKSCVGVLDQGCLGQKHRTPHCCFYGVREEDLQARGGKTGRSGHLSYASLLGSRH
ncbi:hypothetical protein A1F94_005937 [Pyrenophora tritici-repentis]|uniref:Uncharacterized protein n=1 Tax=Pyrenophora tritici-repentis TaxID=45151 RepID=A0A2W1ETF1_9PLEO|nr:hypothetical protein A1F99_060820 [Pyrenophora tritici-repentis]KAF7570970.1 hypothetical protein PtrM4_109720 [Pyrenophora tritici-repentis]KAG9384026.1 hypothetical protein A1F94_005937 [Pyrenophora tritici-repentis]KAI0574191.1 hypothetical protein Alg130_09792 [Pyrenophora tritici-repentis]KAI0614015.1 hypothetical protein TUN205_01714 [Pyrenophora tritici-repentis]